MWYDPTTGTWTQQDSLNAPLDPTNGNRYVYAGDDPVNQLDVAGLWSWVDFGGAAFAGAAGGCATGVVASIWVPPAALPACGIGAAAGGVGGAVAYGATQLWNTVTGWF